MSSDVSKNLKVPPGALFLMTVMPRVTESVLEPVLKLVNDIILKNEVSSKTMNTLFEKSGLNEQGPLLLSALCALVNYLTGIPETQINNDAIRNLCKELKFSDECCSTFINFIEENKSEIIKFKRISGTPFFEKLDSVNWRIEATLSSNRLYKSIATVMLFEMVLKNGKHITFELSIPKFHQLRFCVADMLREMEELEKKNVY